MGYFRPEAPQGDSFLLPHPGKPQSKKKSSVRFALCVNYVLYSEKLLYVSELNKADWTTSHQGLEGEITSAFTHL